MCETNNDDFHLRLRKTLQTQQLAAENGYQFRTPSRDEMDALYKAFNNLISVLSDIVKIAIDLIKPIEPLLISVAECEAALTWATVYHPRLCHCAKYSKRLRIQVKNITRIVKLYRNRKEEK